MLSWTEYDDLCKAEVHYFIQFEVWWNKYVVCHKEVFKSNVNNTLDSTKIMKIQYVN